MTGGLQRRHGPPARPGRHGPSLRRVRLALLPSPGQAFGLLVLVAVLGAVVVSAPRMIADAGQAAWEQQRARLAPTSLGGTLDSSTGSRSVTDPSVRVHAVDDYDTALTAEATALGLPDPLLLTMLRDAAIATGPGGSADVQVVSRDDAAGNVQIVEGAASATGVLAPVELAQDLGVVPGDRILLQSRLGTAQVEVSGLYVTPTAPFGRYWDGQGFLFRPERSRSGDLVYPPAALLATPELAVDAAAGLGADLTLSWFFPLPDRADVDRARATAHDFAALQVRTTNPGSPVPVLVEELGLDLPAPSTALPAVLDQVDRTVELLSPPVQAVGVGGGSAAVLLVGAWAGLRARRRDAELRALVARGSPPLRAAARAAVEAVLPVAAGLAAGGALGVLLVDRFGPAAGPLPPTPLATGAVLAGGGLAALAGIASVTGAHVARLERVESGRTGAIVARVPWLAVTAAVTVVAAVPLITSTADDGARGLGVLPLVVPLLATIVAAGAATRLLAWAGRHAGPFLRRLPTPAFLAVRRVLSGPGAVRLVVATTALTLGLVVYAGALADSTARTVTAKAAVATGSDVVVSLGPGNTAEGTGALPAGATEVGDEELAALRPTGEQAGVLVVHPEQFADVASWNDALAARPLEELMAALGNYGGDRVPVVLAGPLPDDVLAATGGELTLDFRYFSLPVQVVARADAFPGQTGRGPLLVAAWDPYMAGIRATGRDPGLVVAREVWGRGGATALLDALQGAGYGPFDDGDVATTQEFADRPELRAQTWALGYLRAVALAAGALGLVGVAMYALAQQRRRSVAALLLARMGMSRRAGDAATGLELGLLTGLAALVAVLVALPASALTLRLLDPVPALPPDPLLAVPWGSLAVVLAGVVLLTVGGALLVGRAARRTSGGQVMRDAD